MSAKQKPWGHLLRVVCFLLLFALLFRLAADVLRPNRPGDGCFYAEPANTLDVLFCGSSHMLNAVAPVQLWQDYGIASGNLAKNGQVLPVTYHALMDALRRQKPRLVVVDVYKVIHDTLYGTEAELHTSLDDMPLGIAKLRAVYDLLPSGRRAEYLADFIVYHSRWKELSAADLQPPDTTQKGAQALFTTASPYAGWAVLPEDETAPPVPVELEYLERIVQLCRRKGIELLLVAVPFTTPEQDEMNRQAAVNAMSGYARAWGVPFVNLMHRTEEMGFDFSTDMADTYHVNWRGMEKVTAWLGEYLAGHYDLPDRRGEAAYRDWDSVSAAYDAYLAECAAAQDE